MVVLYGDHLPSFNIQNEELSFGNNQTTEYILWANYPMENIQKDLQTYQLSAYVMERAGIFEGPVFRLHQSYGYPESEEDTYQEDLRILEYDIIYGEEYATEESGFLSKPPMTLGISPILIQDISKEGEGKYRVLGSGFTPFSMVSINGMTKSTTYLSPEVLIVDTDAPLKGDRISVVQVSAVDPLTVLSVTEELSLEIDLSG
jgi:hypothetical protein